MTERLLDAVASLRYKQIEFLIGSGVDVNSRNSTGQTALMITCFLSQEEKRYRMFRFLMNHKADILDLDNNDTSVFQYACMRGCKDIVELIIKKASVAAVNLASTDNDGRTALFYAVTNGNVDIVRLLVKLMKDRGISVDLADTSGRTPLLQATMLGHAEIAKILEVEGRANPRICDREMHMDAKGWAEESARNQKTIEHQSKELSRVRELIFPKLSGCARVDAMENQKKAERSVSLPMISYKDITDIANKHNKQRGLESIAENEPRKQRRYKKKQMLSNKSVDSAMSLIKLSRKNNTHNIHIETVAAANLDHVDGDHHNGYTLSSNLHNINTYLSLCSEQQTSCYRRAAAPPQPVNNPTPHRSLPPIQNRFLKFATLAKVLPNQNSQGINFLSIKTQSRGNTPNSDSSPTSESGAEPALPESAPSPAEGGSMWKRLRKKSLSTNDMSGNSGGGGESSGGSILSRLKKAKTNSVPSINVSAHAR